MIATCIHCGAAHEIDPPAWQVAAGRPFNLVCPACGQASIVRPQLYAKGADDPGLPVELPVVPSSAREEEAPAPDVPDDDTEETQPPPTEEAPTLHDEEALEVWSAAMSRAKPVAVEPLEEAPTAAAPVDRGPPWVVIVGVAVMVLLAIGWGG